MIIYTVLHTAGEVRAARDGGLVVQRLDVGDPPQWGPVALEEAPEMHRYVYRTVQEAPEALPPSPYEANDAFLHELAKFVAHTGAEAAGTPAALLWQLSNIVAGYVDQRRQLAPGPVDMHLRAALADIVVAIGGNAKAECSLPFLLGVPQEVRATLNARDAEIRRLKGISANIQALAAAAVKDPA